MTLRRRLLLALCLFGGGLCTGSLLTIYEVLNHGTGIAARLMAVSARLANASAEPVWTTSVGSAASMDSGPVVAVKVRKR